MLKSALNVKDSTLTQGFVQQDQNSVINVNKEAILLTTVKQT